jgi:hypothetical protein
MAAFQVITEGEETMETRMQQLFANLNEEIESLEAHARRIEALVHTHPLS